MAQYSSQFIPNYSELVTPLRMLTHKDTKWKWGREEQKAFEELRNALSEEATLGYYETGLPTKLAVDAGPHGLGLILFQRKLDNWRPVTCASKSLTPTEQRYSQLEREALAIRWGCERCYVYLIGSKFIIETDHQPLLGMFKPRSRPPLRIERWLLYLQQFDYELRYRPGKDNPADYLSRHTLQETRKDQKVCKAREEFISSIIQDTVPKAMTVEQIKKETARDQELQKLATCVLKGNFRACKRDSNLQPYARVFTELSAINGLIMRGNQIVMPKRLRGHTIKLCHEGHLGIVKTKQLLRSKVWFPGIDREVEAEIAGCIPCQGLEKRTIYFPCELPRHCAPQYRTEPIYTVHGKEHPNQVAIHQD